MKIEILGNSHFQGAIAKESGRFKKWMKINHPEIEIINPENKSKYDLRDHSLIMPLVSLALDMSLQNYLQLVMEYTSYYFKGSLKGDKNEVSINVIYHDKKEGKKKEFTFKGSEKALKDTVERFNINDFMKD